MGARLMEIRSLLDYQRAYSFVQFGPLWLGASDIQAEGNWVWDSNQGVVDLGDEFWKEGRPYTSTQYSCLSISSDGLIDSICSDYLYFYCDKK